MDDTRQHFTNDNERDTIKAQHRYGRVCLPEDKGCASAVQLYRYGTAPAVTPSQLLTLG